MWPSIPLANVAPMFYPLLCASFAKKPMIMGSISVFITKRNAFSSE